MVIPRAKTRPSAGRQRAGFVRFLFFVFCFALFAVLGVALVATLAALSEAHGVTDAPTVKRLVETVGRETALRYRFLVALTAGVIAATIAFRARTAIVASMPAAALYFFGGQTWGIRHPHLAQPDRPASLVGRQMVLAVPARIPLAYGEIEFPAGTPVTVLGEVSDRLHIRLLNQHSAFVTRQHLR